jgi:DNA mismatch repair protein MutS
MDEWVFQEEYAREQLNRQFKTISLKGFGIDDQLESIIAAGAALQYLGETQHHRLEHIRSISRIDSDDHVWLDQFTQRNLEIFRTNNLGGKALLDVINNCLTPMGSRLLRQWLAFPLNKVADVNARLETVSAFVESAELLEELRSHLRKIGDLERMASRLSIGKLHPKEAISLSKSLGELEPIKESLKKNKKFDHSISKFADTSSLIQLINRTVQSDPPALASKGGVIANGINEDLDDLRIIAYSGKDHLVKIQQEESERTGISSLKIGYNNVFGYYLEVTNTHKDKVPEEWIRKQTLTNAERYITEELKEYEQQILGAEEKIQQIEIELYDGFLQELAHGIPEIQQCARAIAELDCLGTFAFNARAFDYCRPILSNGSNLLIKEGRHAVIEREMPHDETYIPNDILLNKDEQQLIMLTGPNMSGKSALLRQTAIIVLMAQIGSYVAATEAEIGIVDKIFTRVGASDNISQGESTFMVEMNETASILNNLSDKSLILLDEIGRGTSTYDGISIAWAIAEYLHQHEGRPLTLFATHYHELNEMTDRFERIRNFTISIREAKDKIIFLRKLIEGGSEHSFGIHVATMAGMPSVLIKRAEEVLKTLEGSDRKDLNSESLKDVSDAVQMSIFQLDDPVLSQIKEEIQNIEIDSLTPVEALFKLNEIKKLLGSK